MAESVQEVKPPEPPPAPPEVPKATEQSNHSGAADHRSQSQDSQQAAQQDARNGVQSEHAKATAGEPDGLRPTPEFQARLDEHTAEKNGPEGLRPTPEFQADLDAHTAAKAERDGATQQDASGEQRDTIDAQHGTDPASEAQDGGTASQSSEQAAARESAAVEHAEATGPQDAAEAAGPQDAADESPQAQPSAQDVSQSQTGAQDAGDQTVPAEAHSSQDAEAQAVEGQVGEGQDGEGQAGEGQAVEGQAGEGDGEAAGGGPEGPDDQPPPTDNGYEGPDRRQYEAKHLDPASDMRQGQEIETADDNQASDDQEQLQTGGELRPPRNDIDFVDKWADDAYEQIRADPDDVAAIARTAESSGFTPEDIQAIKDHVFDDEHLLDSYDDGTMARFDANPRMAEAWGRLADGDPHPADFDLLRHERFEADHMASTGDPSYKRAHAAAIEAGFTWDSEAAANDGFGYQQR